VANRSGAVHVVTTKRTYKGRVYQTHLLRHSYRDGDKVKNETVGNLSHLPDQLIDIIRRSLKGEMFAPVTEAFAVTSSKAHGHVKAVLTTMRRLGFESLLGLRAQSPTRSGDGHGGGPHPRAAAQARHDALVVIEHAR
jgi:hypothetical protein